MPSLSEFSRRITLRGRKVAEGADALTRKVALAADQAVVSGTPVDTGRARSNWIAAIGSALLRDDAIAWQQPKRQPQGNRPS